MTLQEVATDLSRRLTRSFPEGRRRTPARRRRAGALPDRSALATTTSCSTSTSTATTAPGSARATRPAGPAWSRSCCSRADPRPHAAARARTLPWERGPRGYAGPPLPMPRFKLLIEYAGTRYSGWQIQKNARTVQGEIDRAVATATGRREFELYGSGRTDAGVHALAQVAHLDVYTTARARAAPPENQRRASRGHPHPIDRQGAASLPRAPRCPVAELPLSNLTSENGVREAVRVVDSRAPGRVRHAGRCRPLHRDERPRSVHRRRSGRKVHARPARIGSSWPSAAR